MIRSMTGFASARGELAPFSWSWELRSVNAKGLDLRLRVPEWLEGLETAIRADLGKALTRGSVTLSLRLSRGEEGAALSLNPAALAAVLEALSEVEDQAMARGMTLAPSRAADLLALRGVLEAGGGGDDPAPLVKRLKAELGPLIAAFLQMRETEGKALAQILQNNLTRVAELTAQAADLAEARKPLVAETLRANLARVLGNSDGADPDRVAQELALLAVKADVTEELDRLHAHIKAARDLLAKGGAVGRKLDFLMQEFNREANTLCSKSQNADLTGVGLELKAVIDQMREQVQNVE
ncbi:YicC family protein [Ruegeria pomeroyi]|uniref:YicC family protein n=1 Tax=Ruegeria alba TaxID=2916756 RepID=A0ABS9NRZ6_9RHOB|nr:YicC/YloC family endoribonuclease [Ruegeria alba]MCE8519960.1 YicC family protein [Ruegeria pomeroyi]MCE8527801.1 YicC family protein [Ruegeria pomeroyi]MCE8532356.1 YicC family protein [Ruegeria pomeroyi]MCG6556998.1 YicC family protein [Ruegeria alba]